MKMLNPVKITSVGAALEYYDFAIFALLTPFFSQHFFVNTTPYLADIASFMVFALGYFFRPLGGIIFGIIGDRFGRKVTFASAVLVMGIATGLMGLLPTFTQIGIFAPILFIFLRIIQGISYGAELPGSLTFLIEHTTAKWRNTSTSFMISSVTLGSASSAFIIFLCTKFLSDPQMHAWGWRLPFWFGSLLAIVGFIIRRKTLETPYFLQEKHRPQFALIDVFKQHKKMLFLGIGLIMLPACCIIFYLSLPSLLQKAFGYESSTIYLAMMLGNIWTTISLPIFGVWYDKTNKKKLLLTIISLYVVFSYPLFYCLNFKTVFALYAFVLAYQTLLAGLAGGYFVVLASSFPTSVRFTGTALSYNLAHVVSSMIPILALTLWQMTQNPIAVSWIFMLLGIFMFFSVFFNKTNYLTK